jgi:aspartate carbamoyltransferase regulatory subunit
MQEIKIGFNSISKDLKIKDLVQIEKSFEQLNQNGRLKKYGNTRRTIK